LDKEHVNHDHRRYVEHINLEQHSPMSENTTPQTPPVDDPEPEGIFEVEAKPGEKRKVVEVGVVAAERKRVREATAEKLTKEFEPLKQKAEQFDRLQADVQAMQPYIEHLKAHPELMKQSQPPEIQQVGDEEAERYARHYELYTAQGLDLNRAKRMIADNRAEMRRVAQETAQEVVKPYAQSSDVQASRQNFLWAAQQKDGQNRPLVDPAFLAEEWSKVPAELTARPEVAQVILNAAIGQAARAGKLPPAAPTNEPVFSEPSGGRSAPYQISTLEQRVARNIGLSDSDWTKSAQTYKPDAINVLGD
jgi:hypothetical protein